MQWAPTQLPPADDGDPASLLITGVDAKVRVITDLGREGA